MNICEICDICEMKYGQNITVKFSMLIYFLFPQMKVDKTAANKNNTFLMEFLEN